jgi:hypothetical protein
VRRNRHLDHFASAYLWPHGESLRLAQLVTGCCFPAVSLVMRFAADHGWRKCRAPTSAQVFRQMNKSISCDQAPESRAPRRRNRRQIACAAVNRSRQTASRRRNVPFAGSAARRTTRDRTSSDLLRSAYGRSARRHVTGKPDTLLELESSIADVTRCTLSIASQSGLTCAAPPAELETDQDGRGCVTWMRANGRSA